MKVFFGQKPIYYLFILLFKNNYSFLLRLVVRIGKKNQPPDEKLCLELDLRTPKNETETPPPPPVNKKKKKNKNKKNKKKEKGKNKK